MKRTLLTSFGFLAMLSAAVLSTDNYQYGADEYVTIEKGLSPDRKYAITTHGGGELGYEHFHVYLTDAVTGKKIGPLEEIKEILDTNAEAFTARWSKDSQEVVIVWRVDRHGPLKAISYRIANRRATVIKGPANATKEQDDYYAKLSAIENPMPPEKVFGTPVKR